MSHHIQSYGHPRPYGWVKTCHGHEDWQEYQLDGDASGRRWPRLLSWGAFALFAVWVVSASLYVLFYQDKIHEAEAERARIRAAYEDRIMQLRGEVESINGRLLLNQDEFDRKLGILRSRQAALEQRQAAIGGIMTAVHTAAIESIERALSPQAAGGTGMQGLGAPPAHDSLRVSGREIHLSFLPRDERPGARQAASSLGATGLPAQPSNMVENNLIRLARSQEHLEAAQLASLAGLEERTATAASLLTGKLAELGANPETAPAKAAAPRAASPTPGMGGPFVPTVLAARMPSPFEWRLQRVRANIARVNSLVQQMRLLPVRQPLDGGGEVVSPFGERIDPFLRVRAMHSGTDFRARFGAAVRATAPGRVEMARTHGGYGKVVEIIHANGFTTRYAHLSELDVKEGEDVEAGTIIGRVGSTGRSTGPHLHYEVRRNDEPLDPQDFLHIARLLPL